jgi:hypothetical protein
MTLRDDLVASLAVDDYAFWREALEGRLGPIHEADAQPGFYRRKLCSGTNAPWTPIAIWRGQDGALKALEHARIVKRPFDTDPNDVWTWCADNPISEEAYRAVAERGEPWPTGIVRIKRKA